MEDTEYKNLSLPEAYLQDSNGILEDNLEGAIRNIRILIRYHASEIASHFNTLGFVDADIDPDYIPRSIKKDSENIDVLTKILKQLEAINE